MAINIRIVQLSDRSLRLLAPHFYKAKALRAAGVTVRHNAYRHDLPDLLADFDSEGFAYGNYPNHQHYGICLASASWVVREIVDDPGWKLVWCGEMAWDRHQDVFACQKV